MVGGVCVCVCACGIWTETGGVGGGIDPPPPVRIVFPLAGDGEGGRGGLFDVSGLFFRYIAKKLRSSHFCVCLDITHR